MTLVVQKRLSDCCNYALTRRSRPRNGEPKLDGASSRLDRRQERLDAEDVRHAREIVGKNV